VYRGYLIHAYNNTEIDYGTMALCSALLIKKNLKVNSTALVTATDTLNWMVQTHGEDLIDQAFDHILMIDVDRNVASRTFYDGRYTNKMVPYYNSNRSDSLELSPFDETILLDSDYLVLDSTFDNVWGCNEDLLINRIAVNLEHTQDLGGFNLRLNDTGIPLYWATAIFMRKGIRAQNLFKLMHFIKENYRYYEQLYGCVGSGYFRNDYALSIAIHMLNGQIETDNIKSFPIPEMLVATEYDDFIDFKDGKAFFLSASKTDEYTLHKVYSNVHVMNKWAIGRMSKRIIEYAINQ
jgi:hypothetical protein